METSKPGLVVLGDATSFRPALDSILASCEATYLAYDAFELGEPFSKEPAVIVCAVPPAAISTIELAQSLRMNYPSHPVYLIVESRSDFNRATYLKNGFSDAFLFPNDKKIFETALKRDIALASQGAVRAYREVQLVDIEPGLKLGFDLYIHMPANNKHLKLVSSRDTLDPQKAQRLSKHQINTASITEDQVSDFYKFSADRLRALGKNDALSETEKSERREKAVRGLLTGIFSQTEQSTSLEAGRGIMEDCKEIVKSYIVGERENSWYERFLKISSSSDGTYNHASNVASIACMLAIGLGYSEVEELGLAGLLHDIGLADLPAEICGKGEADRTAEEQATYQKHPQSSVDMIKSKKMIVPEKVLKIILQHHERYDGTGYPNQVGGERLMIESQILHVADEIDKIMTITAGNARVNPLEAVKKVLETNVAAPGKAMVSPELAKRLLALLPN